MMKKIGVMGGTFDPVHLGHLAIAEEARQQIGLEEVIFLPAGRPYFKDLATISPAEDRINMLKLALAGKAYFRISLMEIMRPGPSYAVDSIAQMKEKLEPDDEIFFIMGWDSLMTLHLWQEPQRLISLCRVAAAPRPGYSKPDIALIEKDLPGISQRVIVMEKPLIDISATDIRQRVLRGLPIDHLVPVEVARYIREHQLYRKKK
jgi:nicotinate-nucleotide adenylyltransferase